METINQFPEWLNTAVLGAVIAAIGYVAKLLLEWLEKARSLRLARRARLVELYSLLRAGRVAYEVQCKHRDSLERLISARDPEIGSLRGYEYRFAAAYSTMTEKELELHTLIRSITTNTLQPLNKSLLKWLRKDNFFKARTWGKD